MEDDDYWEKKATAVSEWFEQIPEPELVGSLDEACYTVTEMGLLGDYYFQPETAITAWKLVESVRLNEFPKEFCM